MNERDRITNHVQAMIEFLLLGFIHKRRPTNFVFIDAPSLNYVSPFYLPPPRTALFFEKSTINILHFITTNDGTSEWNYDLDSRALKWSRV